MDPKNKLPEEVTRYHAVWVRFRKSHKDKSFIHKKDAAQYIADKFGGGHDPTDFAYTPISLGSGIEELVVEYYGRIIAVILTKRNGEEY